MAQFCMVQNIEWDLSSSTCVLINVEESVDEKVKWSHKTGCIKKTRYRQAGDSSDYEGKPDTIADKEEQKNKKE